MKFIIAILIYSIFFSASLFAQHEKEIEQTTIDLLQTDSLWIKEIFTFPIRFAKEIDYKGIEEAQFPKGWSSKESPNFWSYVFVWNVEGNRVNSVKELEADLKTYFDGLMGLPNTITQFTQKEDSTNNTYYVGKVSFFDNLRTKQNIELNVLVQKQYCEETNKSLVVFRFSPKDFNHQVWNTIEKVILRANACDFKINNNH
ncbi:MAG: hypothetical protein COB12_10130 [Flavobacterium sp.]|nr:MAG: hypothetical protein COB12_10130 [Flavobacterium sp.]